MTKRKSSLALGRPVEQSAWQKQVMQERIAPYDLPIRNNWLDGSIYNGKELEYRGKEERKVMK